MYGLQSRSTYRVGKEKKKEEEKEEEKGRVKGRVVYVIPVFKAGLLIRSVRLLSSFYPTRALHRGRSPLSVVHGWRR